MPKIDNSFFYQSAISKHGISPRGVHWINQENQYLRFEILVSFLKDIKSSTIVDAGCGFGDLYLYLNKVVKLPKKYIGIDVESKMVQIAKRRTNQDIFQKDIITDELISADYYIASGSLNILTNDECFKFIRQAYLYCNKGFVFNLLHTNSITNRDIYNGFEPFEIVDYCKNFSNNVLIKDGYIDGDFTIFMQKDDIDTK